MKSFIPLFSHNRIDAESPLLTIVYSHYNYQHYQRDQAFVIGKDGWKTRQAIGFMVHTSWVGL